MVQPQFFACLSELGHPEGTLLAVHVKQALSSNHRQEGYVHIYFVLLFCNKSQGGKLQRMYNIIKTGSKRRVFSCKLPRIYLLMLCIGKCASATLSLTSFVLWI